MAGQKSKRSRKKRNTSGTTKQVRSQRRVERTEKIESSIRERQSERRSRATPGAVGERPPSPFGGLPVSEIAIFAGLVGLIIGLAGSNNVALFVGAIVTAGGVAEVTAREHFSGFRSHTILLAAIPAVVVELVIALAFGIPHIRALILLPPIPIFAVGFWQFKRRFSSARQARVRRS